MVRGSFDLRVGKPILPQQLQLLSRDGWDQLQQHLFVASASSCNGHAGPGASCTVAVSFKPTIAGARGATLSATASPGGSASAALSGTAISSAAVTLAAATGSTTNFELRCELLRDQQR
jgi:hypothetical protein